MYGQERRGGSFVEEKIQRSNEDLKTGERPKEKIRMNQINQKKTIQINKG